MTESSSSHTVTTMMMTKTPLIEEKVERVLVLYVLPVIVATGTIGNAISFAVLTRPRMRRTSVYFYLTVLTCADTAVLFLSAFKTWIRLVSGFELLHVSDVACRTTIFSLMFSLHFSAWLLVLVTCDRFVAVWFPFRAASLCNSRRALTATVGLAVALVVYNVHLFWTMELHVAPPSDIDEYSHTNHSESTLIDAIHPTPSAYFDSTVALETSSASYTSIVAAAAAKRKTRYPSCSGKSKLKFMQEPYEFLKLLTYSILPFVVILIVNVLIVSRLRLSAPIRRNLTSVRSSRGRTVSNADEYCSATGTTAGPASGDRWSFTVAARLRSRSAGPEHSPAERQTRVTYMLLVVSIAYLFLSAPFTLNLIVSHRSSSGVVQARYQLLRTVFFLLFYCNHAINFFLYCLTGKKFRHELHDMFSGVFARCRGGGGCLSGGGRRRRQRRKTITTTFAYSPSTKTLRTHLQHDTTELRDMTTAVGHLATCPHVR